MNTFISDKLGEVTAFARIGIDTLKKGEKGFLKILDEKDLEKMNGTFKELEKKLNIIVKEHGAQKEVEKQAKETEEKVTDMRDTYIGDEWEEESELLEWMGFYTGAALVHWKLISGAAKNMKFEELMTVSSQAVRLYDSLLTSDEKILEKIGGDNSK